MFKQVRSRDLITEDEWLQLEGRTIKLVAMHSDDGSKVLISGIDTETKRLIALKSIRILKGEKLNENK